MDEELSCRQVNSLAGSCGNQLTSKPAHTPPPRRPVQGPHMPPGTATGLGQISPGPEWNEN